MAPPLGFARDGNARIPAAMSEVAFSQRRITPNLILGRVFRRVPPYVGMSQTTVYDTGGSATAVALVGWVFRS